MSAIAVDFDGPVHRYSAGWGDGSIYDDPVPGALTAIKALRGTYAVFIHTSRDPEQVVTWLAERGVPAVAMPGEEPMFWEARGQVLVTNKKLPAVAYIDDRGIRFTSWPQALADLERHTGRTGRLSRLRAAVRRDRGPVPAALTGGVEL